LAGQQLPLPLRPVPVPVPGLELELELELELGLGLGPGLGPGLVLGPEPEPEPEPALEPEPGPVPAFVVVVVFVVAAAIVVAAASAADVLPPAAVGAAVDGAAEPMLPAVPLLRPSRLLPAAPQPPSQYPSHPGMAGALEFPHLVLDPLASLDKVLQSKLVRLLPAGPFLSGVVPTAPWPSVQWRLQQEGHDDMFLVVRQPVVYQEVSAHLA